jgi:hypothetical protein
MPGWLKRLLVGPDSDDGIGQSLVDDVRFLHRFRDCRRRSIQWRKPSDMERAAIDGHPITGRFGDWTIGIADVDGRRWIVRDRDWFGWPTRPSSCSSLWKTVRSGQAPTSIPGPAAGCAPNVP